MNRVRGTYSWPKSFPELTAEQQLISDDFMQFWHERLAENSSFRMIEQFNHGYSVRHAPSQFLRTLEIGAGLGEHLQQENLSAEQRNNYTAIELRDNMAAKLKERNPDINVVVGDCQKRLDFPDGHFDRIIAIHVLEHLPDLPKAITEIHRLCNIDGQFSVVIPCEGGLAYQFARMISSQRLFEKRYKQPYSWFIEREHINLPAEILHVLKQYFEIQNQEFFPLIVPLVHCNLCIGLTMKAKTLG